MLSLRIVVARGSSAWRTPARSIARWMSEKTVPTEVRTTATFDMRLRRIVQASVDDERSARRTLGGLGEELPHPGAVLLADVLLDFALLVPHDVEADGPRLGVGARIVDGRFVAQRIEICALGGGVGGGAANVG